jgi:hypothetical protein
MNASDNKVKLVDFLKRHEKSGLPIRNVEAGTKVAALAELAVASRIDTGPILALNINDDAGTYELSVSRALPMAARAFGASTLIDLLYANDQIQMADDEGNGGLNNLFFGLAGLALETAVNRPLSSDHIVDGAALRLHSLTQGIVSAHRDGRGELVLGAIVAMPTAFPEDALLKACKSLCASASIIRRIHGFVARIASPQATATHDALLELASSFRDAASKREQRRERKRSGPQAMSL